MSLNSHDSLVSKSRLFSRVAWRLLGGVLFLFASHSPIDAQGVTTSGATTHGPSMLSSQEVAVVISIRDARGLPLDELATVRLTSPQRALSQLGSTKESSNVNFPNTLEGTYQLEVECPGYHPVKTQLNVSGMTVFTAYVYMHSLADPNPPTGPPKESPMSPKTISEIDKGMVAMRKKQYESARGHFTKASESAPSSPDPFYLLGSAELKLGHTNVARKEFEQALAVDPLYDKALLSLGELQLQSGESAASIATLNKMFAADGAGWKTYYLLAKAYASMKQWKDADAAALRAANLAGKQSALPLLTLGEIQSAEGRSSLAAKTWEQLVAEFPGSPEATDAKSRISAMSNGQIAKVDAMTAPEFTEITSLNPMEDSHPWAPPDTDSKNFAVLTDVPCDVNDVLNRGMNRVKTEMENLEQFTATEHIEHQEIDSHGIPGPVKTRQFSYTVFVFPYKDDSVFLEESRDGGSNVSAFPTSLATVGLNSLGISVLQAAYRPNLQYQCEGLATVRGEATWQIRFEEKKGADPGIRRWRKEGALYNIPVKGRIWLTATTYDVLRIETDLLEPVAPLELTRDHLEINYGPVKFARQNTQLWLPWDAEMYMELHGRRYHHKHFLTDYLLFGVDTIHTIGSPKGIPEQPAPSAAPSTP